MGSIPPDSKLTLTRASRLNEPARQCVEPQATPTMTRVMSPGELKRMLPILVELLRETVNGGTSLGFLPPLGLAEARGYWLSLRPELEAGSRLLLLARTGAGIVGSGQLALESLPSARHRAEVQKLFVATAVRGLGVGRSLMLALHDTARQHGRSLLLLNTRCGNPAERFYKGLGYREIGLLPGWTVGPQGERYNHVALYKELSV
jgi:GNAT superfamily N-acetyltransferase